MARLTEAPRSIQEVNPTVPSIFAPIFEKALALNPDNRYQMMEQFSQNLIEAREELRRSCNVQNLLSEEGESAGTAKPPDLQKAANIILKLTRTGQQLYFVGDKAELTVGRARKDVIPTIDLTPHGGRHAGVSRQHSRFLNRDNQWFVEDLSSTNGTYVNGAKIPSHQFIPVQTGDMLRFGEIELEFGIEE